MSGILYVIGTPIGNLGDITLRAIETLEKVEVLYCEDSRVAARLINHLIETGKLSKKPRYVPYNEFNESRMGEVVADSVFNGAIVGLVTDAGMPGISDPGYRAIRACHDRGLPVQVIPGVTALTTALPYSGIGGEVTVYAGFLPKTSGKAQRILEASRIMMESLGTGRLVLYVSPHRLLKDLELIKSVMGNVTCVLCRELTKMHEERVEAKVEELIEKYKAGVKGELVLIIGLE
ncbi:16S rRNA (cytidine(1402)-2'-O)-methyltransferase [Candidatus Woesebacteria bacterium]|nr:16S rRNA (cytidine(1402)-2'-O)-methyltransferase [Candidatus Woesebacteria bacterium]